MRPRPESIEPRDKSPLELKRCSEQETTSAKLARIRAALGRWYGHHRRDLPWRRTRDPYAIWVSEVMLQQTQVATVVPYYRRFLARFPDAASLAAADEEQVLAEWSGLGYYRRARALHAGARAIVARHDGRLPQDLPELLALPGIGRYTAGAIASIAYDRPAPVLDGNIRRVLARLFAIDARELGRSGEEKRLWELAGHIARCRRPGDANQALMELGALVCTPRRPACGACPVRVDCRAAASGDAETYPRTRTRRSSQRVRVAVAWIRRGTSLLIERPTDASPLRGTWDLPALEIGPEALAARAISRGLSARHGFDIAVGFSLAAVEHGIMHRRLEIEVYAARIRRGRVAGRGDLRWISPGGLGRAAVSGATHKIARAVERSLGSRPLASRRRRGPGEPRRC